MTQLTSALEPSAQRRANDTRNFKLLFLVGFTVLLPMVAARRIFGSRRDRAHDGDSLVAETRGEVLELLAFVFMV